MSIIVTLVRSRYDMEGVNYFNRRDVKSLENLYGTEAFYLRTMIMRKLRKRNVRIYRRNMIKIAQIVTIVPNNFPVI